MNITLNTLANPDLVAAWLAGRNPNTLRSYRIALEDFARHLGLASINQVAEALLTRTAGEANGIVLAYRAALRDRKLGAATQNHRLAAIRSLVKLGRVLGLVNWEIEIENTASVAYRDTRGPGKTAITAMITSLEQTDTDMAIRDIAVIRLLFDRGLRRGEVAGIDLCDVDDVLCRVRITGKGRTQEEWLTIAPVTMAAIQKWIERRGKESGPLFVNLDPVAPTARLSEQGIYRIVRRTGTRSGAGMVRPHGLRHSAITHALDKTNGNIRKAAKFARHARIETTRLYDDNRQDFGGEIARLISD